MIHVLFVCAGNICRSPMAEAVFQQQVIAAGLDHTIVIDSAGTGSWHIGSRADSRTLTLLQQRGIPYDGRARQIAADDLMRFEYVLVMDRENLAHVQRFTRAHTSVQRLFLSYAYERGLVDTDEVPDPYYDGTFERVYHLVSVGGQALLDHLRQHEAARLHPAP
jgi:protein-tyrosine phosphatase